MGNKKSLIAGLAAIGSLFALAGCATVDRELSEVPLPLNFQAESMMKLKSVAHWNSVALDMANGVAKKYGTGNGCIPGFGCKSGLYVKEPAVETKFSRAFHAQLISALVNQGFPVSAQLKPGVTTVELDIQVVPGADAKTVVEYDRKATELSDGVWVVRDLTDTSVQRFKSLNVARWAEGDTNQGPWFRSPTTIPAAEMMVTVSFVNEGMFVARTSNVYYLPSADGYVAAVLAAKAAPPAQAEKAASSQGSAGAWTMQVVGDCTPARCFAK